MYNLLVTSHAGAWDLPAYEYERERFCEHTAETLRNRFKKLTAATIEELKSFPTLLAYEGRDEIVRAGYIRRIKERGRTVLVEYEFDDAIPAFNFSAVSDYRIQLQEVGVYLLDCFRETENCLSEMRFYAIILYVAGTDARAASRTARGRRCKMAP